MESALVLTGCMYVADAGYLCTPNAVTWVRTQIASGGQE